MSNTVTQIITAMKSTISSTLGASYLELQYVYDLEKNSFQGNSNRYGVMPLEASNSPTLIKASTLDHVFSVVLTNNYANKPTDDYALQERVGEMYDKLNDVEVAFYQTKLGIPSVVIYSEIQDIEAPEVIEEHKIVVLRANFLVKHRTQIP